MHGAIPARTVVALADRLAWLPASYSALGLPLSMQHGTEDKLALPDGGRRVHDVIASGDKTLTPYDGLYHENFNELPAARAQVFVDLPAWIDRHMH